MTEDARNVRPSGLTSSFGALVADVYDRIYNQLMTVAMEPGQRISVDALAREFEVSQTPIRAALTRLEAESLVVKNHLRGYRASSLLTKEEVNNLFDLRIMLESYAAKHAADLRTAEDVAELERLDEAMSRSDRKTGANSGYAEFTILDRQMHEVVARACGNDLVRDALARLHAHLHIYRIRRTVNDRALQEHRLIIDGIAMSDSLVAEAAMRSHLEHARGRALAGY